MTDRGKEASLLASAVVAVAVIWIAAVALLGGGTQAQGGVVSNIPDALRTTFADPGDPEVARWSRFIGQWQSGDTDLVLLPRVPFGSQRTGTLFGAVPRASYEGVLSLWLQEQGTWRGLHVQAGTLEQRDATVTHSTRDDSLLVVLAGRRPLRFRRTGRVNLALPHSINIICHRGLSLNRADLMNSLAGIGHSALFGCSGVELDVTVPYGARGEPRPDALRVYHPAEWRSEITGFDSASEADVAGAPKVPEALRAAREAGVPFVYLDPKLQWLIERNPAAARVALGRIVADASAHLSAGARQTIAVGSSVSGRGGAAGVMADLRKADRWPKNLVWALELTRGTDDWGAVGRFSEGDSRARPDIASFNLLRVQGGGGGWLRLFVPSIARDVEQAFVRTSQPVIYWTAHDERQFDGALIVIDRMMRGTSREAGIMTPYPHRLAFHLATRARPQE